MSQGATYSVTLDAEYGIYPAKLHRGHRGKGLKQPPPSDHPLESRRAAKNALK